MGTWDTSIIGNDTSQDVYDCFMEGYNNGESPQDMTKIVLQSCEELFKDQDDKNNAVLALALAQWETKSLENRIYDNVKKIIESESDLKIWKALGADEITLKKRKEELKKFLKQISIERKSKKRRIKPKLDFRLIEMARATSPDGKKEFVVNEEVANGKYIHTSGVLNWFSGGGAGIMYFNCEGQKINLAWLDEGTLLITHKSGLSFTKQEQTSYFRGDQIEIRYEERNYT